MWGILSYFLYMWHMPLALMRSHKEMCIQREAGILLISLPFWELTLAYGPVPAGGLCYIA